MTIAYIAGFFDGEGHIDCPGFNRPTHARYAATMTQKLSANRVLYDIQSFLALSHAIKSVVYTNRLPRGNAERVSRLSVSGFLHMRNFLTLVRPHLIVKADTADEAILVTQRAVDRRIDRQRRFELAVDLYMNNTGTSRTCLELKVGWGAVKAEVLARGGKVKSGVGSRPNRKIMPPTSLLKAS